MKIQNKFKIINDPIYGFITIPSEDIFNIIEHPYFQRLRRIAQMGLSYLVYPGAHHTRFHHALGCMHLMQTAVQVLRSKGVEISYEEEDALNKAILLHDIGHGPFSHALENSIVSHTHHEALSLLFMEELNRNFNGSLTLAISIFKGEYHRPFMLQLISSQLDMDRLDYLKRDSFYTGVAEGNINSQRLISMLNVSKNQLVIEEKGIYSVEHFLISRRLMYWQVYLHKTGIAAEHLLQSVFKRVRELTSRGKAVWMPDSLHYFMNAKNNERTNTKSQLDNFSKLDDSDVLMVIKQSCSHDDFVLSTLCKMIINRNLLKVKFAQEPIKPSKIENQLLSFEKKHHLNREEAQYFIFSGVVENTAYAKAKPINIVTKLGKIIPVSAIASTETFEALSQKKSQYYYCFPKSRD